MIRSLSGSHIAQAVAALLVALTALLASSLWTSREAAVRLAELSLLHEARLQAQQIDAAMTLVDFTIRELSDDLSEAARVPGEMPEQPTLVSLTRRHLASARTAAVVVYRADGSLAAAVGRRRLAPQDIGGFGFFQRHRDQLVAFQYEAAEQIGLTGGAMLGLSRAVVSRGQFAGVVLALVDLEQPYGVPMPESAFNPEARILFDPQGLVLAVWPSATGAPAASPDTVAASAFADVLARPVQPVAASHGDWVVVVHQLAEFPFRLGAAMPRDAALAGWWREAHLLLLTLGGSAALLLVLVGILVVQARRRRAVENTLHDQFAFRKVLLDTLPLPVFWKDAELRYLGCNAAYEALVHCRDADIVGRSAELFYTAEDAAAHQAVDRQVLNDGVGVSYERPTRFPGGPERVIIVSKAPFMRADGSVGGIVGVIVDVTERRRAEERTAALLKALEHSPSTIVITDADGTITYVNPTFTQTTGYSRDEVIGRNPRILQSGDTPHDTYTAMWRTISAGRAWHGEFRNRRKNGQVYWERAAIAPIMGQDGRPVSYVAVKDDINAEKLAAEQVWMQAHVDALTGLANRITLRDRLAMALEGARRDRGRLAMLYIDLDRFKPVNDTHGHEIGDELLVQVAGRLRANVRDNDTLARLGGDEFVVLMTIHTPAEAEAVAARILVAIAKPFTLSVGPVEIGASIGASVYPVDAEDPDTLIRHADAAMYLAKQAGRSTVRFYDPEEAAGGAAGAGAAVMSAPE